MKKLYLLLSEITMIIFLFSGCECGPGSITEPIERPEPEIPPSPPPPPPQPPTTQNEYFQIEGNNLVYFDGVNKHYLIKNKVENIRFEKVKGEGNAYYVTVNLRLKDGEIKT
ncbi:MAG: hypothetical protein NZ891_01870, partial [bacterium]|nr:hypothetical protein [bacterium]MDW8163476.1 hypothetical protein [Candidatus Omnitrophota bacterium]